MITTDISWKNITSYQLSVHVSTSLPMHSILKSERCVRRGGRGIIPVAHRDVLLVQRRVKAAFVKALGADNTEQQDTSSAITHVARLHLGVVHQTVPAIPVSLRNGGQLRLQGKGWRRKGMKRGANASTRLTHATHNYCPNLVETFQFNTWNIHIC